MINLSLVNGYIMQDFEVAVNKPLPKKPIDQKWLEHVWV